MSQLIELVFEGLTRAQAFALLSELGNPPGAEPIASGGVAESKLDALPLPGSSVLRDVHLRRLPDAEGRFDVELNFSLESVEGRRGADLQQALFDFARRLAETVGARHYFAGLEPARDIETRLFTGTTLGPITLREP